MGLDDQLLGRLETSNQTRVTASLGQGFLLGKNEFEFVHALGDGGERVNCVLPDLDLELARKAPKTMEGSSDRGMALLEIGMGRSVAEGVFVVAVTGKRGVASADNV